jgi:ferritin-like metal-binding protein YciE/predicted ester cyclase
MASRNSFLVNWVRGAYGQEMGLVPILEQQMTDLKHDPELRRKLDMHLQKTREHAKLLEEYLQQAGINPSSIRPREPVTASLIPSNGGKPDIAQQTVLIDYVNEGFETAEYRALTSLADMVGDEDASEVFEQILKDEIALSNELARQLPGEDGSMSAEGAAAQENVRIAREGSAALNAYDYDRVMRYLTDDYRLQVPGIAGWLDWPKARVQHEIRHTAFPDHHFELHRIIASGDDVVADGSVSGTQTGPYRLPDGSEIPATGRSINLPFITWLRFRDGKIAEERQYYDRGTILQQLGVMPG